MRSSSTISPRRPGPLTAPVSPPSEGAHPHVEDRRWIMRTPRRVGYGKKCARRAPGRAELITAYWASCVALSVLGHACVQVRTCTELITACRLLQQDGIEVHWTIWPCIGQYGGVFGVIAARRRCCASILCDTVHRSCIEYDGRVMSCVLYLSRSASRASETFFLV